MENKGLDKAFNYLMERGYINKISAINASRNEYSAKSQREDGGNPYE